VMRRNDRGAGAVELALVTPVLVALMLLVVFAGRVADAEANVQRAASEAARAASLRQHQGDAADAARTAADANLAAGVPCESQSTVVDTSDLRPGGTVTVSVVCTASMRDVTFIGVPGSRTFRATAVEPVDRYRGGEL
jgi:Flp pilus assembly protein TadG